MTAPCVIDEGVTFEDFATASEWTPNAYAFGPLLRPCSLTAGKNSLELWRRPATTVTTASCEKAIKQAFGQNERAVMVLDVWAAADCSGGHGSFSKVQIEFSSTTDYSRAMSYTTPQSLHNGWNRLFIGANDWTVAGGESWANTMVRMRISVTATIYACLPKVRFDRLRVAVKTTPTIVMRFDDSFVSLYRIVKPKFDALGWVGTLDVVSDAVGKPGRLTEAHISDLAAAGWELTIYSRSHPVMPNESIAGMRSDIEGSKAWLSAHGYRGTPHYAYSRSTVDDRLLQVLRDLGFVSGHLPCGVSSSVIYTGTPLVEPLEAEAAIVDATVSLATVKGWVDRIVENGASLCLYFHDIGGDNDLSKADFYSLCDHIDGKGLRNLTVSDWFAFVTDPEEVAITG